MLDEPPALDYFHHPFAVKATSGLEIIWQKETYIQNLFAERIGGNQYGKTTAIYKFEKIKRAKKAALDANPGAKSSTWGSGNLVEAGAPEVIDILHTEAQKHGNRGYADNGDEVMKQAASSYLHKVCGVAGISALKCTSFHRKQGGSFHSSGGFCHQSRGRGADDDSRCQCSLRMQCAGGEVHQLPITRENDFLPDLGSIPSSVLERAKMLVLNYPNNPTGASATVEFFQEVVRWAKQNEIVVVHDAAYAALVFEGGSLELSFGSGCRRMSGSNYIPPARPST